MAQFGEILAELRQDRGLTQRDLAKLFLSPPVQFPIMKKAVTCPTRNG